MSTERPQKRLVGWGRYVGAIGAKGGLYSLATVAGGLGLFSLLVSVGIVLFGLSGARLAFDDWVTPRPWNERIAICLVGAILCGISLGAMSFTKHLVKVARKMESVALITRHNTGQLPVGETLVRPSDKPSSQQQTELLRAAGQGQETPAEELLRARQESGQDV